MNDTVTLKIVKADPHGVLHLSEADSHKEMITVGDETAIITHATSTMNVHRDIFRSMFIRPSRSSSSSQS